MSKKRKYLGFLTGFCFLWACGQQQESQKTAIPDSLLQKSYEELEDYFNEVKKDSTKAAPYAKAYLKKSMADRDIIKQANAYYFLSLINQPVIAEHYADSIISLTRNIDDDTYPARGFLVKGLALYRTGKYKTALDQLLKANEYATANNNAVQQFELKYQIGILKTDLGEDEDALAIFRSYLREAEKKYKEDKSNVNNYIKGLFAIGDAYNRNKKYDSAAVIHKKGIEVSLKSKDSIWAKYFNFSMAVTEYFKENYNSSLDLFQEAITTLKATRDKGNLTVCYLYMGKIYKDQGNIKNAVSYFKKVDSIVQKTSYVFPEIKEAYGFLINYYHGENDCENHSEYADRFITVDSLLDGNDKYLREEIKENIDYQQLIDQIDIIDKRRKDQLIWIISLSAAIVFISAFTYYYYRRQRLYHVRLKALLSENEAEKKQLPDKNTTGRLPDLSYIAPETLQHILERLALFEEEEEFLNSDVSLNNLARTWKKTNSKYLTDIIRAEKGKNFRDYITGLRIDYTVERLKNDTVFRKYTIEAIAKETGFKTAGTFSKAFRKRTKIHPSFFIKNL